MKVNAKQLKARGRVLAQMLYIVIERKRLREGFNQVFAQAFCKSIKNAKDSDQKVELGTLKMSRAL